MVGRRKKGQMKQTDNRQIEKMNHIYSHMYKHALNVTVLMVNQSGLVMLKVSPLCY